jgi:hypothetical protein
MSSAASNPRFRAVDPSTGLALVGGKLFTYAAGTTTPQATYANAALTVANTNPIILDANGEASIYVGPLAYKFVLQDATGAAIWTFDNYAPDIVAQTATEWTQYGGAIVYTSVSSFRTLNVDTTALFTAGRRVKATVTAGTVYGTVLTSAYNVIGAYTDISIVLDGASALDPGLSAIYSGLLSYGNPSYLDPLSMVVATLTATIVGIAAKTQITTFTKLADTNTEFNAGVFTCKYPGWYDVQFCTQSKDSGAAGQAQLSFISVNGTDVAAGVISTVVSSTIISMIASARVLLAAGDQVKFFFQGTATTQLMATAAVGTRPTVVHVTRIR